MHKVNMSGKLDQSLDEILSTQKGSVRGRGPRRGRRVAQAGRTTAVVAAPVGGVKKSAKQPKGAVKSVPTGPSGGSGDSRIQVSNLVRLHRPKNSSSHLLRLYKPKDVNEAQIKVCYI
jgi:THO complex subunit 4